MADVRPFRALRYSQDVSLADVICPPFDTISAEQQRALHARSPHNAVRIELAESNGGDRYEKAASSIATWCKDGVLRFDDEPGFYVHRHAFVYGGREYTRTVLFARLRVEPWDRGVVLPHEQTFGAPKEDRLRLLRATRVNTSPVFLFYRDQGGAINELIAKALAAEPVADFAFGDETHVLVRTDDRGTVDALVSALGAEVLYIADGHHRYETALGYREERRAEAVDWTGEEPENFAMVALVSASDPGLLVLPIHRLTAAGHDPVEVLDRMQTMFDVQQAGTDTGAIVARMKSAAEEGRQVIGLATAGSDDLYLLIPTDRPAIEGQMPPGHTSGWGELDYSIANYAVMRHVLGLTDEQMTDYSSVWFSEDAEEAVGQVRSGKARFAVILNPVPVGRVLDLADAGERMPQKSTFFYPKVPTGLLFNPLDG